MEFLHQTTLLFILLSLIIHGAFSVTLNTSYFIQCGLNNSTLTCTNDTPPRTFVSDEMYLISGSSTMAFQNLTISTDPLYSTMRTSSGSSPFSYQFNVVPNTSNILRLHFSPYSSNANFMITTFNGNSLRNNFSISALTSLIIKEFFLWMDSDKLVLKFTPQKLSFAFISVIEIFDATPLQLFNNIRNPINTPDTFNTHQAYQGMETFYWVNIPGPLITPENDTLWRTWVTDDPYVYNVDASQNESVSTKLRFNPPEGSSEEIAPLTVYNTARIINISAIQFISNPGFNINITWRFRVDSGYYYLIRLHFCDIISETNGLEGLVFRVYMDYLALTSNLRPADYTTYVQEPFYIDFIAHVMSAQNITVSIGLYKNDISSTIGYGFLNGLEIMKMTNYNPSLERKKNHLAIILGPIGFVGAFVLILIIISCIFTTWYKRWCQTNLLEEEETPYLWSHQYSCRATSVASPRLIAFSEIKTSTNNFDERSLIGVGGFGKVYKGKLRNGTMVAVKRASFQSNQDFPEFKTEIEILSNIRHRHLVSLIGYCDEHSEMILVYELMEKGTLRNYLYGIDLLPSLSWKQRLEICIGTAKGLQYLHTGPSRNIIHRDVKSTNILLGEGYIAKVSDFGISKLGPCIGETHVSTAVKGSFGYLDPEYFKNQQLTDKSDVYSFGVVLLEVLCARPVIDQSLEREQLNLTEWALMWQHKGELEKIIDPKLVGEIKENSLRKFRETAKECLQEYGIDRPAMGDVLWNLEYCLRLQETEVNLCRLPSNVSSADSKSDITTSNVFL